MSSAKTTASSDPSVYVLVPVHNRKAITRKFLSCLATQTYQRVRLVLIDDGSTDGTAEMVRGMDPDAVILTGDGHLWWGGCMQKAYEWLLSNECNKEDLVFIANDDIMFGPDLISLAVSALQELPDALLGAQVYDAENSRVQESGVHADLKRFVFRVAKRPDQINCLPTRALFVRWHDMRKVKGFHPHLLPHYFADYEYTLRATRLGLRCVTRPDVAVTADYSATGYHDLDLLVGWELVSKMFSVKTPLNPIYRSSFAILACPNVWKLLNLLKAWMSAGFRLAWQGLLRRHFPRRPVMKFRGWD